MTVLQEENAVGESSNAPARKRICLSLSGREQYHFRDGYQEYSTSYGRPWSVPIQDKELLNPLEGGVMINGYLPGEGHLKNSADDSPTSDSGFGCPPVATLCNLGNTCFLNSVLYTLRFTPQFIHNLHHLVADLTDMNSKNHLIKMKSSSLGRNISTSASSSKSWSNKDLVSFGASFDVPSSKTATQVVTEKLHELYEQMHAAELKENSEPYQPDVFFHALRDVNPIFHGNQQHDAHELLVCLLDNIRETCRMLVNQVQASQVLSECMNGLVDYEVPPHPQSAGSGSTSSKWGGVRKSWKLRKNTGSSKNGAANSRSKDGDLGHSLLNGIAETDDFNSKEESRRSSSPENDRGGSRVRGVGANFVAADFEGVMVLQTTCLECEHLTERKETFCDICVPIATETSSSSLDEGDAASQRPSDVYKSAIVTSELLREGNKYWCETCLRYNEARRSVHYESLPRLLILQMKRFSTQGNGFGSVCKVNDYMPTPLLLACFCQECCRKEEEDRRHSYQLYAVIMHIGGSMASGHYIAYVKAQDNAADYYRCEREREKRKTSSLSSSANSSSKTSSSSSGEKIGGLFKFLSKSKSNLSNGYDTSSGKLGSANSYRRHACCSAECCGIKLGKSLLEHQNGSDYHHHNYYPRDNDYGIEGSSPAADASVPESFWLECDDESVRILTRREFEEILSPKSSKAATPTPYLLFYSRSA